MGRKRLRKWYHTANVRRADLIYKDICEGGLLDTEKRELEYLQKKCLEEVNRVHPPPPVDFVELDALEARLRKESGGGRRKGSERSPGGSVAGDAAN